MSGGVYEAGCDMVVCSVSHTVWRVFSFLMSLCHAALRGAGSCRRWRNSLSGSGAFSAEAKGEGTQTFMRAGLLGGVTKQMSG